ncbi:MAG: hypothetical protein HC828_08420 [Blastochloris sp.]|nr:hypothetical protein [Blastochloris sp.]
MMSARLLKGCACFSALIVLFATVGTSHAAPDDPEPKSHVIQAADKDQYEITNTDQGAMYAQQAVERWANEYGIHTSVSDVNVYNMGTPTSPVTLVIPKQLIFKEMSIVTILMVQLKQQSKRKCRQINFQVSPLIQAILI